MTASKDGVETLLIVEDEAQIRKFVRISLEAQGYRVWEARLGEEGLNLCAATPPHLVILDLGLPDLDGLDFIRRLRAWSAIPILVLSVRASETEKIQALDAGANDYVTKPFRFAVLLARIRAHLRSHEQSEDAVFQVGPYEFRPASKLMVDDKGKKVRLTEKETNILKYLYRAGAKPVSREELLTEVWGYNAGVTTHTLETHIYRLRQKIEVEPGQARLLLTDAGGYRLQP